ncbi:MAG: hypothetical protein PHE27_03520 [Alphaproteobacteria bacterium]|nr:hypothetical protein [Alphaproteobacteria bacterium]
MFPFEAQSFDWTFFGDLITFIMPSSSSPTKLNSLAAHGLDHPGNLFLLRKKERKLLEGFETSLASKKEAIEKINKNVSDIAFDVRDLPFSGAGPCTKKECPNCDFWNRIKKNPRSAFSRSKTDTRGYEDVLLETRADVAVLQKEFDDFFLSMLDEFEKHSGKDFKKASGGLLGRTLYTLPLFFDTLDQIDDTLTFLSLQPPSSPCLKNRKCRSLGPEL